MNIFDYYNNPEILSAIKSETSRIKGLESKEDCEQEIFAELYDFMPMDTDEAVSIVYRVGRKFRRNIKNDYATTTDYKDYHDYNDWMKLGDGNYMKRSHIGSAD